VQEGAVPEVGVALDEVLLVVEVEVVSVAEGLPREALVEALVEAVGHPEVVPLAVGHLEGGVVEVTKKPRALFPCALYLYSQTSWGLCPGNLSFKCFDHPELKGLPNVTAQPNLVDVSSNLA